MEKAVTPLQKFSIPATYDFEKSSEANYASPETPFVGKYKHIRAQLDYSYHKRYCVERQLLQDQLIDRFLKTRVVDHQQNVVCEVPLENWIVFTAGPMGAGKGHTMQWLYQSGLFPMDAFVNVDPDALRMLLPETSQYNHLDDKKTGHFTQKEVGYISEILSYDALQKGKNVLVDGSLRNAHWYLKYFRNLRDKFPIIKIAILHVTAKPETVLLRARNRAKVTGRHVPEETILESMRTIPESLRVLSPHSEFVATFFNEDEENEPRLAYCCMQEPSSTSTSTSAFPSTSTLAAGYHSMVSISSMAGGLRETSKVEGIKSVKSVNDVDSVEYTEKERKDRPLVPVWCMRETHSIAPEHSRLDVALGMVHTDYKDNSGNSDKNASGDSVGTTNGHRQEATLATTSDYNINGTSINDSSIMNNSSSASNAACYEYGKCFTNPYFEQHNVQVQSENPTTNNNTTTTTGSSSITTTTSTTDQISHSDIQANSNITTTKASSTTTTFTYTLIDCAHHSEVVLDSWKGLFANTWEMKCALPDTLLNRLNSDDVSINLSAPIVCEASIGPCSKSSSANGGIETSNMVGDSLCNRSSGSTTRESSDDCVANDCNICASASEDLHLSTDKSDSDQVTSVLHKRERTEDIAVLSGPM